MTTPVNLTSRAAQDAAAAEYDGAAICRECGENIDPDDAAAGIDYHPECAGLPAAPDACPMCGSDDLKYKPLPGYLPWECAVCGHLFDINNPNLDAYDEYEDDDDD